ncbi:MAG: hypothetical protein ACOYOB_20070 [Myxococcota bacterium]
MQELRIDEVMLPLNNMYFHAIMGAYLSPRRRYRTREERCGLKKLKSSLLERVRLHVRADPWWQLVPGDPYQRGRFTIRADGTHEIVSLGRHDDSSGGPPW